MAVWSEVNNRRLTNDIRLDAEYYQPQYLALDDRLSGSQSEPWGGIRGTFVSGPFGSDFIVSSLVDESPYRYVRGRDVKPFFLLDDQNCYMSHTHFQALAKHHLRPGDLLISVVGTLGNVAAVTEDVGEAIFSCKSTCFRSLELDPYYLCAYLNSAVGRAYFRRLTRGHVQTGLNLADLRTIPIYRPSPALEQDVSGLVRRAYASRQRGKHLYSGAEAELLERLKLVPFDLPQALSYVRRFPEVQSAGRMDAEYYQPKYYWLQSALSSCGYRTRRLGDLIHPIRNGCDIRDFVDGGVPYIRVGDVVDGRIETDRMRVNPMDPRVVNKRLRLRPGDILFTRKGTYGNAAVVRSGQEDAVISSEIMLLRLRDDQLLPDYLAGYLNSPVGYHQVERRVHGVAFYSITQADLASVDVVVAPQELQEELQAMLTDARRCYIEARELLREATSLVETRVLSEP